MSSEVTATGTLAYSDALGVQLSLSIPATFAATPSSLKPSQLKQSIATSETALKLGDTTAPGYAMLVNLDPTNYVELKVATSGAIFAKLDAAGGFAILKLGSGAQAPYAIANSGACLVEVLIVPA